MGLISSLNRREETNVPSLPSELTKTAVAEADVLPKMFPIKQVLLTFAAATLLPIQITLSAVVTLLPVFAPKAMLPLPVLLNASARLPTAVLLLPVVLFIRAL
jgi:hypothetical protein